MIKLHFGGSPGYVTITIFSFKYCISLSFYDIKCKEGQGKWFRSLNGKGKRSLNLIDRIGAVSKLKPALSTAQHMKGGVQPSVFAI